MTILIEKNVPVQMRDDVTLATDVYRPTESGPLPVLLQRLPYNKDAIATAMIIRMVQAGYVVVVQDCRGVYASAGIFRPFYQEPHDGADTIAWAAGQPWSNGIVGMFGGSYIGATQWLAATTAPAALRAIAPNVTTADYYESWTYQGGALQLGFILSWILPAFTIPEQQRRLAEGRGTPADIDIQVQAFDTLDQGYRHLPLIDMPHLDGIAPYYFDWLAHASYDEYWQAIAPHEHHAKIIVPALNIGGWHDLFLGGTLANYRGMRQRGGSAAARSGQRLIVGPWAHGNSGAFYAEHAYGLMSGFDASDMAGAQIRWFDHWLKGIDNGVAHEKPVKIFVMGIDLWREEDDWPLPDTQYRTYYLHSAGRANTRHGNGQLSTGAPGDEPEDVYLYDPRNPVPTVGGATFLPGVHITANAGPRDQRAVELRDDVLCYTTAPLDRAVEVTGPVTLVLYIAASAVDTDFTAKLVDVSPDGRAELLTDGILRARYRNSVSAPELLAPGKRYALRIDLVATSNVFKVGHRIQLDISSSNFPRFDRNSNTGGTIATETVADFVQSVNRVFHDTAHRSHLILPIIERD